MSIIDDMKDIEKWNDFLTYKVDSSNISNAEENCIRTFIDEERYEYFHEKIVTGKFPSDYPHKIIVNKEGVSKKRVVYSFAGDDSIESAV